MWRSKAGWIVLVIILGLLLTAGVAYAQLKTTAVVYAWDIAALKYQNSNVIINFNGSYVPFWHQFLFDAKPFDHDAFDWVAYDMEDPSPCPVGSTTPWEGVMYYGLYHTDIDGAAGFQDTRLWEIVDCDRTGDGAFDGADLSYTPPFSRTTIASTDSLGGEHPYWILLAEDIPTACTTGNCLDEIVTTIYINTDTDCDGQQDLGYDINEQPIPLPAAGICFYAEAKTPPPPLTSMWEGPLQARISAGGGDKTVNFKPQPTTAVTLRSFAARWAEVPSQSVILWAAIAVVAAGTLGALIWRLRPARR